jgi:enamine deaminase RidA (YjgF/YER057c/UK114 family)
VDGVRIAAKDARVNTEITVTESSIRGSSDDGAPNTVLQPPGWPQPKGFANGVRARGEMVFVGGMIGQDKDGRFAAGFVAQMKQALENIAAVLAQAGASPRHIVRLTWYVRDMDEYLADLPALGAAYREVMGRHFPAMAVVGVNRLVEPEARVEIEATAVLP